MFHLSCLHRTISRSVTVLFSLLPLLLLLLLKLYKTLFVGKKDQTKSRFDFGGPVY